MQWPDLAAACQRIGYSDPAHVLRTLFKGCYAADERDIDLARCLRAGLSDKETAEALGELFPSLKAVQSAIERLRDRMHAPNRSVVGSIAALYELQPWDGHQTGVHEKPWTIGRITPELLDPWAERTPEFLKEFQAKWEKEMKTWRKPFNMSKSNRQSKKSRSISQQSQSDDDTT